MQNTSFQGMKLVPAQQLEERLEKVRELQTTDLEQYAVVKDQISGEHYLHYAYLHLDVAGGGAQEEFHQLLPLESDDVLAMVLGEQPYTYPEHWNRSFLRNGPNDQYVWFDPQGELDEEDNERIAKQFRTKLGEFKKKGRYDEDSVRRMLEEMEQLLERDRPDDEA